MPLRIRILLSPRRSSWYGSGSYEWACISFNSLWEITYMRILLASVLFYRQSSIPSYQRLLVVPFHIVSPVCWIVPRRDQLDPLKLSPYHKNREPWLGTSIRLGIFSLLINFFLILLSDCLIMMVESTHSIAFKVVLSTMIQLRLWFGFRTNSHLESTRLW